MAIMTGAGIGTSAVRADVATSVRERAMARHGAVAFTMAFLVMLSAGLPMPAVRALYGGQRHFSEGVLHAFMSVNMLGAVVGAPLAAALSDRHRAHRAVCAGLALLDATLLLVCTLPLGAGAILAVRAVQGAASVGVLSLVLSWVGGGGRRLSRARGGRQASAIGAAGTGIMLGVALGPAAGGALLRLGAATPLHASAALACVVATMALATPWRDDGGRADTPVARAPGMRRDGDLVAQARRLARDPHFAAPALLAFAERFTVGCFVVTFSLYAHGVRHLRDAQIGVHYSLFLLPFALATYPFASAFGGARDRSFAAGAGSKSALMTAGGLLYGLSFLAFGVTQGAALMVSLVVAGVASAMVYGPSLGCVVHASEAGGGAARATTMALFHACGCLGMLLGPAVAGVASALLRHAGASDGARFAAVFALAGTAQLAAVLASAPALRRLRAASTRDSTHDATRNATHDATHDATHHDKGSFS